MSYFRIWLKQASTFILGFGYVHWILNVYWIQKVIFKIDLIPFVS